MLIPAQMKYRSGETNAAANSLPSHADFVTFVDSILLHVKLANPIKRGV